MKASAAGGWSSITADGGRGHLMKPLPRTGLVKAGMRGGGKHFFIAILSMSACRRLYECFPGSDSAISFIKGLISFFNHINIFA